MAVFTTNKDVYINVVTHATSF